MKYYEKLKELLALDSLTPGEKKFYWISFAILAAAVVLGNWI